LSKGGSSRRANPPGRAKATARRDLEHQLAGRARLHCRDVTSQCETVRHSPEHTGYDPVGNRTVLTNSGALTTNTYNAGNELVTSQASAGVTTSTYDGDGNLLTSLAPGNQLTTNTWDGENRLTRTALPSGIVDSFTYNGDGLRIQKIDSTGTTKHVWDGQNILLETNAGNIIQVVYTLEPVYYGNLISQSRSGTDSFHQFDALGSVRQLANSVGTVTDEYLYDSFGNIIPGGRSGTTTNPFQYIGKLGYYADTELGTYYLRARDYGPSTGRFPSRDPLLYVRGQSLATLQPYLYVNNSPVNSTDPSGLLGCSGCSTGDASQIGVELGNAIGAIAPAALFCASLALNYTVTLTSVQSLGGFLCGAAARALNTSLNPPLMAARPQVVAAGNRALNLGACRLICKACALGPPVAGATALSGSIPTTVTAAMAASASRAAGQAARAAALKAGAGPAAAGTAASAASAALSTLLGGLVGCNLKATITVRLSWTLRVGQCQ
jgi:RHS repeat-associated protein